MEGEYFNERNLNNRMQNKKKTFESKIVNVS